jgi:hypothetical protein
VAGQIAQHDRVAVGEERTEQDATVLQATRRQESKPKAIARARD